MGKYKLVKKLGDGGFGVVYKAYDEVEGAYIALKIQNPETRPEEILWYFKREIRLLSRIDHRNILRMKNADIVNGRLLIASELGLCSLADKKRRTIHFDTALEVLKQILQALIEVQKNRIVHRDIKPENIIVFPNKVFKLGDFGIAKVLEKVGKATATDAGTRGYFAPEQVFGRPSLASDIFSLGLVFYEMITGYLPRYPFRWPFGARDKFNRRVPGRVRTVVRRALAFDEAARYPDALSMYGDLMVALQRSSRASSRNRKRLIPWRKYREIEFAEKFASILSLEFRCCRCSGPISEYMMYCPWCGTDRNSFRGITSFPAICRRCEHGVREEWDYCPWCYGKKFKWADVWVQPDKRYVKNCPNKYCGERKVMRWMHYCPWCHVKLKCWRHPLIKGRCPKCSWSVADDFWEYCAWCGAKV